MDAKLRSIRSNLLFNFLNEIVVRGTIFFTSIYLARKLGTEGYGLFAFYQTIVFYFWAVSDLGISTYGVREISREPARISDIIGSLLAIRLLMGLSAFLIYVAAVFIWAGSQAKFAVALGAGLYLLFFSPYLDWALRGLERFLSLVAANAALAATFLIGVWLFVDGAGDAGRAAFIWSGSSLVGVGIAFFLLRQHVEIKKIFRRREAIVHARESAHFSLSGILLLLYHYIPFLILSIGADDHTLGIFSAAFRVVLAVGASTATINMVFLPRLSASYGKERDSFVGWLKILFPLSALAGMGIAIPAWFYAPEIVQLLFGDAYNDSGELFAILVWLIPLYFLRNALRTSLLAAGLHVVQNIPLVAGVIFAAGGAAILVPSYGALGAALSLLIAESGIFLGLLVVWFWKLHGSLRKTPGQIR